MKDYKNLIDIIDYVLYYSRNVCKLETSIDEDQPSTSSEKNNECNQRKGSVLYNTGCKRKIRSGNDDNDDILVTKMDSNLDIPGVCHIFYFS